MLHRDMSRAYKIETPSEHKQITFHFPEVGGPLLKQIRRSYNWVIYLYLLRNLDELVVVQIAYQHCTTINILLKVSFLKTFLIFSKLIVGN